MISFELADISYSIDKQDVLKDWIKKVVQFHQKKLSSIQFIFGSDEYILEINRTYLEHDFYTDIISFDYCEGKLISGDLFISLDRVIDNAKKLELDEPDELHRVIIHGVLHLLGFKDKTEEEATEMRKQENVALEILRKLQ